MKQLPHTFQQWFAARGWSPFAHQRTMLDAASKGKSALLIAPTGGGKTLAGFLPSLVDLHSNGGGRGLHTLYISPLKALTVDIQRNLETPVAEMGLNIRLETRTGDTPNNRRRRQRKNPPDILMTTPESLALLLSYPDSHELFAHLDCVILDELHALAGTKRGDLLSLGLARLSAINPDMRRVGLSATVAEPSVMQAWLSRTGRAAGADDVRLIHADTRIQPQIEILEEAGDRLPWSGHMAHYAVDDIFARIAAHNHTIVFVNTRAQAEIIFAELWRRNEAGLAIALHHGSLGPERRRKVEAAMARGELRAVVATSSLDLGIDWGDVDLVIQVGAPKGASRLLQRIGRANHRYDRPSKALLVPANRFEVLECRAAVAAIHDGRLDGDTRGTGALDALAQHILGMACAGGFHPDRLYRQIITAAPYADLDRETFERVLAFVRHGGYALQAYAAYRKLEVDDDGRFHIASKQLARQYRMNVGTIVEANTLNVRLKHGGKLGQVEEYFIMNLEVGNTFMFAGQILRYEGMDKDTVLVSKARKAEEPKVPAYAGGRLPLSTALADEVRNMLASPDDWHVLPREVQEWLELQQKRSALPRADELLIETFVRGHKPRGRKKARLTHYMIAYCFEGRNAHQTLGMLITRRMERESLKPLGFVATDYVLAVWSLKAPDDYLQTLFTPDILGDELEEWMVESPMLKRTFRQVAVVAGLIERKHPGHEKTGKQLSVNADLIYDVLRRYEPDHILLEATKQEAARGLTDIARLSDFLNAHHDKIRHIALERVSPLAVPAILEIGIEPVWRQGEAQDTLLDEWAHEAEALIAEATH